MSDGPAQHTSLQAQAASVDAMVAENTLKTLRLMGYSVRETAGAVAVWRIVDSATAGGAGAGDDVVEIGLAANANIPTQWLGPDGIQVAKGLSLVRVSGTIDIVLYWRTI